MTQTITSCLKSQNCIPRLRSDTRGNTVCADCDSQHPAWASLNLGVLICIECSGIHRNLGSHISRVRSLDLDDWPLGHLAAMTSLGNHMANGVWEARTLPYHCKPGKSSSREDKENYIAAKYVRKEMIAPLPPGLSASSALLSSISKSDMAGMYLALAHCKQKDVNCQTSHETGRTPLHVAAAGGNTIMVQILLWVSMSTHYMSKCYNSFCSTRAVWTLWTGMERHLSTVLGGIGIW